MDEIKFIGNNHPDDVEWLYSLSESELDMLISLKKLALRRAQTIGHESLAQKFDLKLLRALGFILMQLTKGEVNDLQLTGLTGLDDMFNGCNLLKLGLEDRIKTEEQAHTEAQSKTREQAKRGEQAERGEKAKRGEQAKTGEHAKSRMTVHKNVVLRRRPKNLKRWTKPEEECFVNGLLEWKADGSYCYKNKLAEIMNENFPGRVWTDTNMQTKYRLLKDKYNMVTEMLRDSGFSWDKEKNMIDCERQAYEELCKQHNDSGALWNVPFSIYEKLAIIFGADRATAVQFKTSYQAVDNQEKETMDLDKGYNDEDEDNISVNQAKQSTPSETSSRKTRKGKHSKGKSGGRLAC